jgi:oligoribonuclease
MADVQRDHLVWLDMEMTGLDPDVCVPIEVAIVITNKELEELDSFETQIWQPDSKLETMEPYVRNMHTTNGLLERVRKSEVSVLDAERKMIAILTKWCRANEGVLAGNSIHQDRRFLARYFPTFSGMLHYRMIDVSTLKELVKRWYGPELAYAKGASAHTALADARESIAELRHYRATAMKPRA